MDPAKSLFLLILAVVVRHGVTETNLCTFPNDSSQAFIENIAEDHEVNTLLATLDIYGNNSEIELSQKDNKYFQLDAETRSVILVHKLSTDRDAELIPILKIDCRIRGDVTSTFHLEVQIIVYDVNNNAPTFNTTHHTVSVPEDLDPGDRVYKGAVAIDNDREFQIGGNSNVLYSLVPGPYSSYFHIATSTTSAITLVKHLDYESIKEMYVEIKAYDNPSNGVSLSSTATLTILIEDADDLDPAFSVNITYVGNITEDAPKGTFVTVMPKISARDQDTMNIPIVYKLLDPYKLFGINSTTGEIWNTQALYVNVPTVTVVVLAAQVDNPMREGMAILTINITGANINAPRFSKQLYQVYKSEEEPLGSTLVTTPATDIDFGTSIQYAIVEQVTDLRIDAGANIILEEPLDYEREQQRVIRVTASDGSHTATTTVEITIADSNDNNPVIEAPTTLVQLDRIQGELVTSITATDADQDDILTYVLETHTGLFEINGVGEIFIKAEPEELRNTVYGLLVAVYDDGVPARQDSVLITAVFPPFGSTLPPTTPVAAASVLTEQESMLTIVLGAVAGFLLVIILILAAYIVWRNRRTKEELDKARAPPMYGAKGLTYRQADVPDDLPKMDLRYTGDTDETSEFDGSTTVQENPLSSFNQGYLQSSGSEMDRDVSEIEIETAVIPYLEGDEFDGGYSSAHNNGRGGLATFKHDDSASSGSSQSDSTGGSRRGLVNGSNTNGAPKMTSWDSDDKIHVQGAQKLLDPNVKPTAPKTKKEKPEITVYF